MPNIRAIIVPAKVLKSGKHKIRISISHNCETRYIVTDIVIDSDKEFRDGIIVKRPDAAMLNLKIIKKIQECQTAIDELSYTEGLTCAELVSLLRYTNIDTHRTLQSIYDEYMSYSDAKESTKKCQASLFNRLTTYFSPEMFVEHITHIMVSGYLKKMRDKKFAAGTMISHMAFLRTLVGFAIRRGYASYKVDPFINVKLQAGAPRESWLTVEEIKKLRDAELPKYLSKYRDLIMLSYYLGGINWADLSKIDFRDIKTLKYVRAKTDRRVKVNKYVEFVIPDEAWPIINKYISPDGRLCGEAQRKHGIFSANIIGKLRRAVGLPNLIYYSARKSFSQHAFDIGVSESVIDYILGHKLGKNGSTLFSYISVTPQMATAAIRKVLDNLK